MRDSRYNSIDNCPAIVVNEIMAISPATLESAFESIVTAIDANDFPGARLWLAKAKIYAKAMPKSYTIAGRSKTVTEDLTDLDTALDSAERAANGAGQTRLIGVSFAGAR